jgi:CRISPR-associated protein Cmr5
MTQQGVTRRQTLEQERGKKAWDNINEIKDYSKARDDKGTLESEYCSRVRGLNAMIQQNGLGTTLGFLKAKSKIEKDEKGTILRDKKGRPRYNAPYLLLQHLSEWMRVQNFVPTTNEYRGYDGLLLWIINRARSDDYRRATTECLAFGLWLRRFAEAELNEKSENSTTIEPTEAGATEGGTQ